MAMTDFTITDADVGKVLPITDGFLVNLSLTAPPVHDGPPRWNEGSQKWVSGYFVLRGSGDIRNLNARRPDLRPTSWSETTASAIAAIWSWSACREARRGRSRCRMRQTRERRCRRLARPPRTNSPAASATNSRRRRRRHGSR